MIIVSFEFVKEEFVNCFFGRLDFAKLIVKRLHHCMLERSSQRSRFQLNDQNFFDAFTYVVHKNADMTWFSPGNLYSDKREHQQNGTNSNGILPNKASTLLPGQGANYNVSHANNITNSQNVSETCPGTLIMSPLCAVSKKDRNKFCGSLPNHLDTDDIEKDSSISDNCTCMVLNQLPSIRNALSFFIYVL